MLAPGDGELLTAKIRAGHTVTVQAVNSLSTQLSTVTVLLRLSIVNRAAFAALKPLVQALSRLPATVNVVLEYYFPSLPARLPESVRRSRCYAGGKHCAWEGSAWAPNEMLDEGIRQICAYNSSRDTRGPGGAWMTYFLQFSDCITKGKNPSLLGCYNKVRLSNALPASFFAAVDKCYLQSFASDDRFLAENTVLAHHAQADSPQPHGAVPAVFVQGELVRPQMTSNALVREVCTRTGRGSPFCASFFSGVFSSKPRTGQAKRVLMGALALLICLLLAVIAVKMLPRWQSEKIRREVSEYTTFQVKHLSYSFT